MTDTGPDIAERWFERGCEELKHNRYQGAARAFTSALRSRPGWHEALQRRALVRHFQKRPDLAVRDYRKALKEAPRCAYCWEGLADAQTDLGRHRLALVSWNCALAIRPSELGWCYDRGMTYLALGKPDEAIRDFRKARRGMYGSIRSLCARGVEKAQRMMVRMKEQMAAPGKRRSPIYER